MSEKVRHIRPRKLRRVHGLQLPLHPQQVLAWIIMVAFIVLTYGAIVPALHSTLHVPVAIISGILFVSHVLTHFLALGLDPADPELRSRKNRSQIPEFDRNIHSHVIENGRCHLCNITTTSSKTKHCSSCNKCVDVFDHHCKWLNHCIGKRNYKTFIACVVTAILSCLMIMSLCLAEIILYYFSRERLSPFEKTPPNHEVPHGSHVEEDDSTIMCKPSSPYCHFVVFGARIYDGAFIGILSAVFSVSLVAEILLIHLAAFHIYIYCLGVTTYEYIREQNAPRENSSSNSYGNYAKDDRVEPEGAICGGWTVVRSTTSNQITPSSTQNTTLQSASSHESFLSSLGSRSPRISPGASISPSTPNDGSISILQRGGQGNVFRFHHKDTSISDDKSPTFVTNSNFPKSNNSTVPSLPFISKSVTCRSRNALRNLSRSITSTEPLNDANVEVKLVAIPRPKPSRRRLGSSVAPHLSPIKECDLAASSPPSVRGIRMEKQIDSNNSRTSSKGSSPNRSHQRSSPSRVSPIMKSPPDSFPSSMENYWASPSHSTSSSSPSVNSPSSGSLLKKTSSPRDSPSLNKHLYSNPQTKVFVLNDQTYNSPGVKRNDSTKFSPSTSNTSGLTSVEDSPSLLAHLKGKSVAISIVNGVHDSKIHSSVVENGLSETEKRRFRDRSLERSSSSGSDYSNSSKSQTGFPVHRSKTGGKSHSPANRPQHVELHM